VSRRLIASLAAAVAILAIVAGCGGGDDNSSLTKEEFSQKGNAICSRATADQQKALTDTYRKLEKEGAEGKKAEETIVKTAALPPIAKMTEELGDLGTPEGEEAKAEEMVKAFEAEVRKIEEDPQGALQGTVGSFDKANKLATQFNMEACAGI